MGKVPRKSFWNTLPYTLALVGAVFSVLWVFNLFLQKSQSVGTSVDAAAVWWTATDRLVAKLQGRLSLRPADSNSYVQLGSAYLQKARETGDPSYYAKAEGVLLKALELEPKDLGAMSTMGALALARHQFPDAFQWASRALELDQRDAYIYGVLGDAQIELGQYEAGIQSVQAMVDLKPDLSSYARVSYVRELMGDIEGAIEAMKMAVGAGAPKSESTAWTRVQLGHLYFNSGDLAKAEGEYGKALTHFPGYFHAQAGSARVMAARGQFAEAIALYQQVVERIPLPEYVIALGDVHTVAGNPEKAAKFYSLVRIQRRLYQANGVNTDLEMTLFDADHDQDLDSALTRARQEYQRRSSIWAADVLAWTLYKRGEYQEALGYSQEARKLGTKDALLLFHAGLIEYKLGNRQQAKASLEQALSINPYFSVLYRNPAVGTLEQLRAGSGENRG